MPEIHVAESRFLRIDAAAVWDADAACSPGSLLLELRESGPPISGAIHAEAAVLAVGPPGVIEAHPAAGGARVLALPEGVVIPGLVNAHTHLDLTHIGPRPFDAKAGFLGFVTTVRSERRTEPAAISESVRWGVELSLRSGVVAVGDIAGAVMARANAAAVDALGATPMWGVSYLEYFAIGRTEAAALERAEAVVRSLPSSRGRIRLGLQPHATNTVSPNAYRWTLALAQQLGLAVSTHLAETPEEREFIARATGPQRELLEKVGAWEDSLLREYGLGLSPVAHFGRAVGPPGATPRLVAHVNDLGEVLGVLAGLGTSVAYCPTASEYFGSERHFGPHRYREMMDAGVNVALGTDSIINLPGSGPMLSVWEEMRRLRGRDGTAAATLLKMATVNGARALGLEESHFRFAPGNRLAGIAVVEGVEPASVLEKGTSPRLVLLGK